MTFTGSLLLECLRFDDPRVNAAGKALYVLRDSLTQQTVEHGPITAPVGTLTDFASIPDSAHWYLDKDDPSIALACIIHDHLYKNAGRLPDGRVLTRKQADELLRAGMIACGARPAQARVVYWAVRLGGGRSWGKGHEQGITI